jgi:BTB/POZ domain-containing protein KCTD9
MSETLPARLLYEKSYKQLQNLGVLAEGAIPPPPDRRPQHDDDDISSGFRLFRTWLGSGEPFGLRLPPDYVNEIQESDCENLTLPRTFFGRSEISRISFKNSDLSESTFCWNDFIEVNFTDADLSECDLRASLYKRTLFVRTNLRNADLRWSTFKESDFTGADLRGTKLTHEQGEALDLSAQQRQVIDWQENEGEEPPGG